MNEKTITRLASIICIVLLITCFGLVALTYVGPSGETIETAGGDFLLVPASVGSLMVWMYFLLATTVILTIVFSIIRFVKNFIVSPEKGIRTIVPLVFFILIFVVAWFAGSSEELPIFGYEGNQNFGSWAQLTDMFTYTLYTLFTLIILAIIGSQIYVKIK